MIYQARQLFSFLRTNLIFTDSSAPATPVTKKGRISDKTFDLPTNFATPMGQIDLDDSSSDESLPENEEFPVICTEKELRPPSLYNIYSFFIMCCFFYYYGRPWPSISFFITKILKD